VGYLSVLTRGNYTLSDATMLDMVLKDEWRLDALCRTMDSAIFTTQRHLGLARHMCLFHCPVLTECHEWSSEFKDWYEVCVGGVVHLRDTSRVKSRERIRPADVNDCHICTPAVAPIVSADPPRHGTTKRYRLEKKNGGVPCEICTVVYETHERAKQTERQRNRRIRLREERVRAQAEAMSNDHTKVEQ